MNEILLVAAERQIMGEIQRNRRGHLAFIYDDRWRSLEKAYPLSLSMPLDTRRYKHVQIDAWLQNLLPSPLFRRHRQISIGSWLGGLRPNNAFAPSIRGKQHHISFLDVFDVLAEAGWDLPEAVQIIRPEWLDDIFGDSEGAPHVEWLTESDIAGRLRAIAEKNPEARLVGSGPDSATLPGFHPKMALFSNGNLWGVPCGREGEPTTHILKPAAAECVVNEHLCLALADALGLPAARSAVRRYEDVVALVVERYDRARLPSGSTQRLHQEDLCQVMGLPPPRKRMRKGDPGCKEISGAIWRHSSKPQEDIRTFARAILLGWFLGGTDTHARNFVMLIRPGAQVRLAPLYDLVMTTKPDSRKSKMEIRVGGKYRIRDICARHWIRFSDEISLPADEVLHMGKTMAKTLPEVFSEVVSRASAEGVDHPVMARMADLLDAQSRHCAGILETSASRLSTGSKLTWN